MTPQRRSGRHETTPNASVCRRILSTTSAGLPTLEIAAKLVRDTGFDPVIVSSLARGKQFEPDTPPYNSGMSGQQLRALFGQTTERDAAGR